MKKTIVMFVLLVATSFTPGALAQWKPAPLKVPQQPNPQLYDTKVNAEDEIREAKAGAAKQHKRILLVFGGNWCGDCHALDYAFHQPRIEPLLNTNFIVVHVDIGRYDKNLDLAKRYHIDLEKGVPSIAVLDAAAAFLYSTSEFEKARLMTEEDVIAFLDKWKPQPAAAAAKN